jgi:TRAP-type C4-dicarboxylate transport system permease small subunit
MLEWLRRALELLNRLLAGISMLAMLAACLILTSSVATRYFFKMSTDWQDEASVFLLVGATFLSGAYVQAGRGHIGIGVLGGLLPERLNRVRLRLCDAASLLFCAFFAWKSWTLFHEAWVDKMTTSSTFSPPLTIPYGLMAAGMTLLVIQLLLQTASHFVDKGRNA